MLLETQRELHNLSLLIEFGGVGSSDGKNAPNVKCFEQNILEQEIKNVINNYSISKDFCYVGRLDGKRCSFKIDMGSDVSIVSSKFVKKGKKRLEAGMKILNIPLGRKFLLKVKFWLKFKLENIN